MKVKVLIVVCALFAISSVAFLISSCGDDNSGADKNSSQVDCNKFCSKAKECNKEITDEEEKKCLSQCKTMSDYYQSSYASSINSCIDKACEEIESCLEKAAESCKAPDYMPYVNAACDKMVECKQATSKEECVTSMKDSVEESIQKGESIKCATDKYITDVSSCIKNISCDNFLDNVIKCASNPLSK